MVTNLLIATWMNNNPSPFTNRATTPVFIGVSRGEGCLQNLHPTFTLRLYIFLLDYD